MKLYSKSREHARACVVRAVRGAAAIAALWGAAVVAGCGTTRMELTEEQFAERARADLEESQAAFAAAIDDALRRTELARGRGEAVDFLAISGGGDYGAFGAGFLVGWGSTPDEASRRPEFDVVTGVSTGALIAPFAYIGTDEALLDVEHFYRNPKRDWLRDRGMLFFWPSNPSFMELPGLERDVRAAAGREFIGRLADESRAGKVLVISATDLDFGRQKLWNVGDEAERVSDDAGVDRVQRILLASSAIPAVFPPVKIGDAVYADGGVTANVLLKLDTKNPHAYLARWRREHPDTPLPKVRFWIIINNQLRQAPKTVQVRWPSVVQPSLLTATRSATIAEVRWLSAEADYANTALGTDIEVRVVSIPDDWRPPVVGDFKEETMRSLADLGRRMGADPSSWTLWTARDGSAGGGLR